jgi:hypothetical protein
VAQRSGGQRKDGASDQQKGLRSEAQRAEDRLEDWGGRVGGFLASAVARAREEAEDIWAEAQSIRRGERN